ncbi:hypothetical protein F5884DRAFT_116985 [Xylogone sp. PMI_703]|nr:hypothetical protein F5884DRAFT_116985 [Xylogone sp. PMI_703]
MAKSSPPKVMAKMEPSTAEDLMFVNISHPGDIRRQREVQTKIRQHVMRSAGHDRRRQAPEQETTPSALAIARRVDDHGDFPLVAEETSVVSPGRSLEALGSFPIEGNMRVLELVRFFNESASFYLPFRKFWFDVALTDAGAFHVTMGNTAVLRLCLNPSEIVPETLEITKHYSEALMLLGRRLNSVSESSTHGTIANILAHVCLNMKNCNWLSWRIHMDGLKDAIDAHGGLDSLEHPLPILVTQYALGGAMALDSFPQFPLPAVLTEPKIAFREAPLRLQLLLLQLNNISADTFQASQALQNLSKIADVVNVNSYSDLFWKNEMGAFSLLIPFIHFLLWMPRLPINFDDSPDTGDLILREMVRLVCLILMSRLKEVFKFFTVEKAELQAKFASLLPLTRNLSGIYLQVKAWALVTVALLSESDIRELYLGEILSAVPSVTDEGVYALVEEAREFIWIDILESPFADKLKTDLMQHKITHRDPGESLPSH